MTNTANTPAVPPEQNGTAPEELAYRLRQQQLTAEFGHFALKTHELSGLLQEATRICALGMQTELCKVMEYLPSENQFIVRAGVGWKPGVVGKMLTGADIESPAGYAFHTGQPVISNHLEGDTRFRTPHILQEHGVKRAINVLLQSDGERFGVLEVDSPERGRFTDADLAFMQGFANLVGVAVGRQKAEDALKQSKAQLAKAHEKAESEQRLLIGEMGHRIKNMFATVSAVANLTLRNASDLEHARQALSDRLGAMAQAQDILIHSATECANILTLVETAMQPYKTSEEPRVTYSGPDLLLGSKQALALSLMLHELTTNALKYGALSNNTGRIDILWSVVESTTPELQLIWVETGGPPVQVPTRQGFGSTIIGRSLAANLGGTAKTIYPPHGIVFTLNAPLEVFQGFVPE